MLFLDGVYIDVPKTKFKRVVAPTHEELVQLVHTVSHRIARFLERRGLLVRDAENAYLDLQPEDESPMDSLMGHSITYRIATGPNAGRKVFTLQTLPAIEDEGSSRVASMDGFSLHAGVATQAHERDKLERVCRYFALQGCRVLRRLGTIASAPGLRYRKGGCRSRQQATSATVSKLHTVTARLM